MPSRIFRLAGSDLSPWRRPWGPRRLLRGLGGGEREKTTSSAQFFVLFFSPTAESFGDRAPGWSGAALRKVPRGFHEGSTRVPPLRGLRGGLGWFEVRFHEVPKGSNKFHGTVCNQAQSGPESGPDRTPIAPSGPDRAPSTTKLASPSFARHSCKAAS